MSRTTCSSASKPLMHGCALLILIVATLLSGSIGNAQSGKTPFGSTPLPLDRANQGSSPTLGSNSGKNGPLNR